MNALKFMSGTELDAAETVQSTDVIASLTGYVVEGRDIHPAIYDTAINRCEPPMDKDQLQEVIDLCVQGISRHHRPKTPSDHVRYGRQKVRANMTQSHYAALLGATSVRLNTLESSSF